MKKIILLSLLLITSFFNLFPQWSNDPNNNLIIGFGWDPHIVSDSAGGCYITYNYESFYPQKLAVERLDMYGYKPWGDKKQILGVLPEQWQAEIIEDGEGGVIVSYQDNQVVGTDFTSRVRVQRVDSNGNFLWGQTGVRVTVEEKNHGGQHLVSDGAGGCVILWQDYDGLYYLNQINELGQRIWGDSGIFIGTSSFTNMNLVRAADGNYYAETGEYIYRIRQNGEITLWESTLEWGLIIAAPDGGGILHSSIWNPSYYKLIAQRKDTLGNNLWQEPYVEIADSVYINTQLKIQYNNGYYYYGWSGTRNGIIRVAQFQALRLDGSKLFPDGSISISNNSPLSIAGIVPSDSNKTIFVWNNHPNLPDTTFAHIYDTLGNKLWKECGVVVAHPAMAYQYYTTDGNGGFIIGGTINEFTIVAQQVSKYGKLGEIVTLISQENNEIVPSAIKLYQNYPNPFNSSTHIKFEIPEEVNVKINLYNILGEKINTIIDEYKTAGSYSISITLDEIPSGIYFYTLETGLQVLVKKLTLLK